MVKKNFFLLFVRFVYIKNKNLCFYLSQMIAVKVLHHTLLSPPSIWGHHLSVTNVIGLSLLVLVCNFVCLVKFFFVENVLLHKLQE